MKILIINQIYKNGSGEDLLVKKYNLRITQLRRELFKEDFYMIKGQWSMLHGYLYINNINKFSIILIIINNILTNFTVTINLNLLYSTLILLKKIILLINKI